MKEERVKYRKNRKKSEAIPMNITKKLLIDRMKSHLEIIRERGYEAHFRRIEAILEEVLPLRPQLVGGFIPWEEPNGIIGTFCQVYSIQGMNLYAAKTPNGFFGGLKQTNEEGEYVTLSTWPWILTSSGFGLIGYSSGEGPFYSWSQPRVFGPEPYYKGITGKITIPENEGGHYTITLESRYTGPSGAFGPDRRVLLDDGEITVIPVDDFVSTIIIAYLEVGEHEFHISTDYIDLKGLRVYKWGH